MRKLTIFLLALFISLPAFARVTAPDGAGKSIVGQKMLAADLVAGCAAPNWFESTCDDSAVAIGICTQQEADDGDLFPTVVCNQTKVDAFLCRSGDLTRDIPNPSACRNWLDAYVKGVLSNIARKGYKNISKNAGAVDQEPDPIEDDQ